MCSHWICASCNSLWSPSNYRPLVCWRKTIKTRNARTLFNLTIMINGTFRLSILKSAHYKQLSRERFFRPKCARTVEKGNKRHNTGLRAFLIASRTDVSVPKWIKRSQVEVSHHTAPNYFISPASNVLTGRKFVSTLLLPQPKRFWLKRVENGEETKARNNKNCILVEAVVALPLRFFRIVYASGYASMLIFANSEWHHKTSSNVNK